MEPKKNSNVDLKKRSVLFLQTGLILVLLFTYLGIEWKTNTPQEIPREQLTMGELDEEPIPITVIERATPPPLPPPADVVKVIDDEEEGQEDEIESTESEQEDIIEVVDIVEAEKEEEPVAPVPFTLIENVPVFPGCESLGTNAEKKDCMSQNITQFINKHFDRDLGSRLGLKGMNRVNIIFKIDQQGNITDVQSRAPHPKLEEEAERVINLLPKMEPGKQRGKPVPVSYSIPIIFQVH